MSRGGLRRLFRETEREGSVPGVSFWRFARGRGECGRIYCLVITISLGCFGSWAGKWALGMMGRGKRWRARRTALLAG